MNAPELFCPSCYQLLPVDLYWHPLADERKHLGARCARCARWIKWVPQTEAWLLHSPTAP